MVDSEQLSTGPATQADAIINFGSSSINGGAPYRRSNEVIGRQRSVGKPTEVGREQPLAAAQAGTGHYMQPASHPSHTHNNRQPGCITRSKSRFEKVQTDRKVRFVLANNRYFEI